MDGLDVLVKRLMNPKYRAVGEGLAPPLAYTYLHNHCEKAKNCIKMIQFFFDFYR
jgi:hypothetical protein